MSAPRAEIRVRHAEGPELENWDSLVRRFDNHRVTHLRAWSQSLAACGFGTPQFLVIEKDGDVVGCLPGLLTTLGPLRLFGSPRAGWQTVSMGPTYDPARLATDEMAPALIRFLERDLGVHHIELMHTALDAASMKAAGFRAQSVFTYRAPLHPGDERRTWRALKDSAQRNVKRAQRLGLVVRFEEDEHFVDEHYEQLVEVYVRNGAAIPFTKQRLLACFRHMRDAGNLIAVSVYLPSGRVNIATGMFFVEGRELSLWMWAHRAHYRWYRPTELMTWAVMQRAMAQGCDTFDFMGGGTFKMKLGGEPDETKRRWIRSRPQWLIPARRVVETAFHAQQTVRGTSRRIAGRVVRAAAAWVRGGERLAPACVIGDVDLVRALGLAGIRSVVAAPPGDAAHYSRHATGAIPWSDPWDQPERLVDALISHGEAQGEPPVLFYDSDASLLLISRHRERLARAFRFVVANAELVESLVDKGRFLELARRHRLPVPCARICRPDSDAAPELDGLPFPVIVKPLIRRPKRWAKVAGHGKAIRVDTLEALRSAWSRIRGADGGVLIQSLVPGPETRIESYHVYADTHGAIVGEFTGRKIRTAPAEYGDSTALEITDAPDVAELGRDIVGRLHLTGVAKLDFKRGPDGALHLLEINPRFTLWHHLAARAGLNVPALVYGDLTGRPRPGAAPARAGTRWSKPWADRGVARAAGIPLPRWLAWTLACEATRAFAWDDPLPLLRAGLARGVGAVPHNSRSDDTITPVPTAARQPWEREATAFTKAGRTA